MGNRKKTLFDKFSNQLRLLNTIGLIDINLKYDKTYICPLCLDQFSASALETDESRNYLTEEDAPPASLGGNRIALTCKKCNSQCGHNIDYQLKELIEHQENSNFIKGTIQRGRIDFEGKSLTAEFTSEGDGKLKASHSLKRNNPPVLSKFIDSIKKDKTITFQPKKNRLDGRKINYAFYKTNYIITFSKFGYLFLLDEYYNDLRKQILNPDQKIVNFNLTIQNELLGDHIGTHYILDSDIKAIFNIFKLTTSLTENTFGSFLPIPGISFERFVEGMEGRTYMNSAKFNKSVYDNSVDLFTDVTEMLKIKNWISS